MIPTLGQRRQNPNRKRPEPKKKYYEASYGKPDCPYQGKKKGRKTNEEKKTISSHYKVKVRKGDFIMYFD